MDENRTARLKEETSKVVKRWVNTPYYEAVEKQASAQWRSLILPFLHSHEIDFSKVLELAIGHGRMTAHLLERSDHVIAVDVLQENIDFCAQRFESEPRLKLIRNDGVQLTGVDDHSITFGFCFDSMIHFDSDVVRSYLTEFQRVLTPGGTAFLHHSNLTRNPGGDFQKNAHARNFMSQAMFKHYAIKEGLEILKSQVIDWGQDKKKVPDLDCLSLVRKPR